MHTQALYSCIVPPKKCKHLIDRGENVETSFTATGSSLEACKLLEKSCSIQDERSSEESYCEDMGYITAWQFAKLDSRAPALDGLRGIAILLSIFDHLMVTETSALVGHFAVSMFFVLSGFLISGALWQFVEGKKQHQTRYYFLLHFYSARFARLFPGQVVVVALGCLHLKYLSPREYDDGVLAQSAVRLLTSTEESSQNIQRCFGNVWSLAVEEWSYVFLSILIPFLPVKRKARLLAVMLPIAFFYSCKLFSISRIGSDFFIWSWREHLYLGIPPLNFDWLYGTPTNMWKIGIGVAARLLPWPCWIHRNRLLGHIFCILLITLIFGQYFYLKKIIYDDAIRSAIVDPIASILTACTILSSLSGSLILELPILRFFGRVSYSWYLWQWPLIDGTSWGSGWKAVGVSSEALFIAYMSTVYVEEPILRAFRELRGRRRNGADAKPPME